tara:strand:- start:1039 stop:1281 length:243 start_codon:yes stop_codon:yes gene_type:complete
MKKLTSLLLAVSLLVTIPVFAKSPKAKFYDFQEQLIDGQLTKPTALYTDARQQIKFERLLSLKKSFIRALLQTSKERVFK